MSGLFPFLLRIWAVLVVAVKRLFSQRWLALATALGLATAVALATSVPLYADAVYTRVLREELSQGSFGKATRPPFAFLFNYVGAWHGPVEWEDIQPVDAYLSGPAGPTLGLPQRVMVRYFETSQFPIFPQEGAYDTRWPLTWLGFAFISDVQGRFTILEGNLPAAAHPSQQSAVEVLISEPLAAETGFQVGETYTVLAYEGRINPQRAADIPVRISGIWRATDPGDEFWFYDLEAFDSAMLVPEETFTGRINNYLDDEVSLGLWYWVMEGSDVHPSHAGSLLTRIYGVQQRAAALLPNIELSLSPAGALQRYQEAAGLLTILLYVSSVPVLGLILVFIGLVVGLSVARQRNEIAVLRSRGATAIQVVGIAALEGLLLGGIALVVGVPAGVLIATVIGRTRSFLDFTLESGLRVRPAMATVCFGATAAGLALLAQLAPTVGAVRHTIVTYKQERARALRPPWWQRSCLDVLLIIPAAYGAYLLRQRGGIALPVTEGARAAGRMVDNPFQNPLLFLVPALGIFALTLFILRILPLVMAGIAWIASHTGGVGILLAARHLSRLPGFYTAPLVLLVLTLSLSAFTASLAETLDSHLHDQAYYEVGADVNLAALTPGTTPASIMTGGTTIEEGARWIFRPVFEYLQVPGVQAAARVGRYRAASRLSGGAQSGTFIGIDRVDFSEVAFWRWDFAPVRHQRVLMNALASSPNGVLVPRSFLAQHALAVGDTFRVTVNAYDQRVELDMQVVGCFDYFPTWYEEDDGPLFVGNLDHFFEQAGGQFPYRVWLKTDPRVDYDQIAKNVGEMKLGVPDQDPSSLRIYRAQRQPERQGLFGVLSVGFMAAALLTVLGFLLYAFFSFRRRFIEMGILRAIGLSTGQMTLFLAWELALLILVGLVAGTGLGAWVSALFIPHVQVGAGPEAYIPPFVVQIAWPAIFRIYALFGLLFMVALGGLTALLLRIKIFQAVKLGEST